MPFPTGWICTAHGPCSSRLGQELVRLGEISPWNRCASPTSAIFAPQPSQARTEPSPVTGGGRRRSDHEKGEVLAEPGDGEVGLDPRWSLHDSCSGGIADGDIDHVGAQLIENRRLRPTIPNLESAWMST